LKAPSNDVCNAPQSESQGGYLPEFQDDLIFISQLRRAEAMEPLGA
jgi:hypothetical protein